jgi:acyl-homoserine lactone acylase PvdQ
MPRLHALLLDPADPLRADVERAAGRSLAEIVRKTVATVGARLAARQGAEASRWRWGDVHRVWLGTIVGLLPGVGRPFVALDDEFPGDEYTVSPSRALPFRGRLYAFVGATSRFVCDLSRPDEALFAHSAGPSADPHTTFFASLSGPWQRFEYFRSALWRAGEVPEVVERLVAEPAGQAAARRQSSQIQS